jgi:hypothetical protein
VRAARWRLGAVATAPALVVLLAAVPPADAPSPPDPSAGRTTALTTTALTTPALTTTARTTPALPAAGPGTARAVPATATVGPAATGPAGTPWRLLVAPGVGWTAIPLYTDGVVLDPLGGPVGVEPGVIAADDAAARRAQDAWLADGTVPGPVEYRDMAERALRDLDALLLPDGAVIAGVTDRWAYVWPRDASFAAAALARTGHVDDALAVLRHLAALHATSPDGVLEARYLPDGSGRTPDDRERQLDGSGWVLWAVAEWYAAAEPGTQRDAALETLRPLVVGSVAAIRDQVDPGSGLPDPHPDYWEVAEDDPTLGTVTALLLGVRAVGPVLAALGEPGAEALVEDLERGVAAFAPGYPRHVAGTAADTAVAFLMPPFAPVDPEVRVAWAAAAEAMRRAGGGLAPGASWRADGISWTPTTAVFALTAAGSGDLRRARAWLDWLDEHRTPSGSLPEKVLADGSPSAVAPLAWTSALVVLALDELDARLTEVEPGYEAAGGPAA